MYWAGAEDEGVGSANVARRCDYEAMKDRVSGHMNFEAVVS